MDPTQPPGNQPPQMPPAYEVPPGDQRRQGASPHTPGVNEPQEWPTATEPRVPWQGPQQWPQGPQQRSLGQPQNPQQQQWPQGPQQWPQGPPQRPSSKPQWPQGQQQWPQRQPSPAAGYPYPLPQMRTKPPRKPLDPAKKEEVAQTLLYTVGSAVLLAGLVLLVALFLAPPASLLVYFFALGLTIISMIVIRVQRSSTAGIVVQLMGAVVGLGAISAAWDLGQVAPVIALSLASLLTGLTAFSARLVNSSQMVVWLAGAAVLINFVFPDAFISGLVGVICLAATIGKGWPLARMLVAIAVALAGLQGIDPIDPTWPLVWLVPTVVMSLWLVHFHKATPVKPSPVPMTRPTAVVRSRGHRGGQPWGLGLVLLSSAWLVSVNIGGVPLWTPLLLAAVVVVSGLALPEPPDAVDTQGPLRDWTTILGVTLLALTLGLQRLDSEIELLAILVLAIAAQFLRLTKPPLTWVARTVPAVFALFAAGDAVLAVWGYPSELVSDPMTIVHGILLTILGVALLTFRQGPPSPVLDGARMLGGLYLCVHGVVLAATLIGSQFGDLEGGFLAGHALASLGWMSFAAWLYLRRTSTVNLTVALVVALGAVTKLIFHDMAALSGVARVAAFMGCGAIMVGIAFLRQRQRPQPPGGPMPRQEMQAPQEWAMNDRQ